MKENKHNDELLQFANDIFQKVLDDQHLRDWYNSLSDIEKADVELMAKSIALQVKVSISLKLKPINIKNHPKPIISWYD